jgi:UDP:flavonoid glycosyltransferase YjiC (YdhE family)
MRVMFVCLPATGHLLPLLPLAGALRDAGHTVAFATAAGFAPQVERAGFPAIAAGMETEEWDALSGTAFGEALPEWDSNERIAAFGARVFAGGIAQRLIEDLPSAFTAWSADLVVHEDTALGGALAAELVGLKHVRIMILAAGPAHPLYSRIDEAISLLRDRNGLKPDTADATLHRYLLLHPFPPSLLLPDRPVPATYRSARPVLPPPSDDVAPEWLEGLGREGRPVVYATLGTLFNGPNNDAIFAAYLAALRDEPVDAIVTIGANRDPAEFGPQPPNIHIVPYVSLATVLPRCDLVLSHGGSGTVVAALALGLPQVVVPIFADQPENAARVAALGAGQVISPRERTPEAIRTAILTVLAEPTYRQSAERIRNEISALPQLEETVTLLEQLTAAGVAVNTTST